jgi:flagellar basal-body rod protein FlgG
MLDSLYIGATGMQAQQLNVDTIANNLANVNTANFKKSRVSFGDLMIRELVRTNPMLEQGAVVQNQRAGAGVSIGRISKQFDSGELKQTGAPLDLAIQGDGFFEIVMPDGSISYSRGGSFKVGTDGVLSMQNGNHLKPAISIPPSAQKVVIDANGLVKVTVPNQPRPLEVGRLEIVRFTEPSYMQAMGDGLYRASEQAGEPMLGVASRDGAGTISQGFLEGSNVKLVDEMVGLMC